MTKRTKDQKDEKDKKDERDEKKDKNWTRALNNTLSEWESDEDEKAYRNL